MRHLWAPYLRGGGGVGGVGGGGAGAIVFVVDAADPARWPEAQRELHGLLALDIPVAVLGNKADEARGGAGPATTAALAAALQLPAGASAAATEGADAMADEGAGAPRVALFLGSAWEGTGYLAALAWLGEQL